MRGDVGVCVGEGGGLGGKGGRECCIYSVFFKPVTWLP